MGTDDVGVSAVDARAVFACPGCGHPLSIKQLKNQKGSCVNCGEVLHSPVGDPRQHIRGRPVGKPV